jgi:hypothetical protein
MNEQQQQVPWLKEAEMFPFNVDVDVTFPYGPSGYEPKDGPYQRQYTCTVDINGGRYKWSLNYVLHDTLVSQLALSGGSVIRMKRIKPAQGKAYWSCINSGGAQVDVIPDTFPQEQQQQQQLQQPPAAPAAPMQTAPSAGAPVQQTTAHNNQPDHSRPLAPANGQSAQSRPADDMATSMMYCIEQAGHMWTASGLEFTSDNVQGTASTMFIQMSMKNIAVPVGQSVSPPPQMPDVQASNAVETPANVAAMPAGAAGSDDDLPF